MKQEKTPAYSVESETVLTSEINGLDIVVCRQEKDVTFDHELNVKVMKSIIQKDFTTVRELAERLLRLDRVVEVKITHRKSKNSTRLLKD